MSLSALPPFPASLPHSLLEFGAAPAIGKLHRDPTRRLAVVSCLVLLGCIRLTAPRLVSSQLFCLLTSVRLAVLSLRNPDVRVVLIGLLVRVMAHCSYQPGSISANQNVSPFSPPLTKTPFRLLRISFGLLTLGEAYKIC